MSAAAMKPVSPPSPSSMIRSVIRARLRSNATAPATRSDAAATSAIDQERVRVAQQSKTKIARA